MMEEGRDSDIKNKNNDGSFFALCIVLVVILFGSVGIMGIVTLVHVHRPHVDSTYITDAVVVKVNRPKYFRIEFVNSDNKKYWYESKYCSVHEKYKVGQWHRLIVIKREWEEDGVVVRTAHFISPCDGSGYPITVK